MRHALAPSVVSEWAESAPVWAVPRSAKVTQFINGLGAGETAAISIALEIKADAILTDDRRGIREATRLGVNSLTTFAILEQASNRGLIDFSESIADLSATTFRMPPEPIVAEYLKRNSPYDTSL